MTWSGRARRFVEIALALALVTGGCAPAGHFIGDSNARTLAASEGIIVTTMVANFDGRVTLGRLDGSDGDIDIPLRQEDDGFVVMAIPAGKYRWATVREDKEKLRADFGERYTFEVKAGIISYIGDPQFMGDWDKYTCELRFANHGDATRSYLRERHPALSAIYPFENNMTEDLADRRRDPDPTLELDEPRPPPVSPRAVIGKVLQGMRAYRDEMCACLGQACVARVSKAMARWSREFGLDEHSPRPTPAEQAELDAISRATKACAANGGASVAPQPAAGADPGTTPQGGNATSGYSGQAPD